MKNDKINIEATIRSLQTQNFRDYEHIIVDGCSTDGTSEKIKKLIKNKKRIIYIRKKDKNLYQALNSGIKVSRGNFIGILHSGDKYYNNKTLKLVNSKIFNSTEILFGYLKYVDHNSNIKRFWNYKFNKLNKYNCYKIAHTTTFINRKIFNKIGDYNTKFSIASDTDFLLRISKIPNISFILIKKTLIIMKTGGLSTSYSKIFRKVFEDLNIYYQNFQILFLFFYIKKLIFKLIN